MFKIKQKFIAKKNLKDLIIAEQVINCFREQNKDKVKNTQNMKLWIASNKLRLENFINNKK